MGNYRTVVFWTIPSFAICSSAVSGISQYFLDLDNTTDSIDFDWWILTYIAFNVQDFMADLLLEKELGL
ncbi:hypothetical protein I4300191C4_13260 [Solibaculum mannosilyticum]